MKKLLYPLFMMLVLLSCSDSGSRKINPDKETQESVSNSIVNELIDRQKLANLTEPFDILLLETNDNLSFTTGGLSNEEKKEYCGDVKNGFYGRYYLINKSNKEEPPFDGTIDIYKPGEMSNWKTSDNNQTIWKIHLRSDVITIWDSLHVGMSLNEIMQFSQVNNGLCIKKGDSYYSCDFNNFSVVFNFQNDTLREFTVRRNCEEKR